MKCSLIRGIGWLSVVLGLLSLSLQFYLLPIIQSLTYSAQGHAYTYAMDFLADPTCVVAMLLSVTVIGIVLISSNRTES